MTTGPNRAATAAKDPVTEAADRHCLALAANRRMRRAGAARRRRASAFGSCAGARIRAGQKRMLMRSARRLARTSPEGEAYGALTAKALAIYEALLWTFHNERTGLCFPSYERIAEASGASRQTVARCLPMLEAAGLITWVHRLRRVVEVAVDAAGREVRRLRVLRTSNAYDITPPERLDPALRAEAERGEWRPAPRSGEGRRAEPRPAGRPTDGRHSIPLSGPAPTARAATPVAAVADGRGPGPIEAALGRMASARLAAAGRGRR